MVQELKKIDHVLRAARHNLSQYKKSEALLATLLSMVDPINEVEDQIELFQTDLPIWFAQGKNLDYWGKLFNVPDRPEDDEDYRSLIFAYMAMYYSQGTAKDVRNALISAFSATTAYVWDSSPGNFSAQVFNPSRALDATLLARVLDTTKAAGVGYDGVNYVPGQYRFLAFEDFEYPTVQNGDFEYWEEFNFSALPDPYTEYPDHRIFGYFVEDQPNNQIDVAFRIRCPSDDFSLEIGNFGSVWYRDKENNAINIGYNGATHVTQNGWTETTLGSSTLTRQSTKTIAYPAVDTSGIQSVKSFVYLTEEFGTVVNFVFEDDTQASAFRSQISGQNYFKVALDGFTITFECTQLGFFSFPVVTKSDHSVVSVKITNSSGEPYARTYLLSEDAELTGTECVSRIGENAAPFTSDFIANNSAITVSSYTKTLNPPRYIFNGEYLSYFALNFSRFNYTSADQALFYKNNPWGLLKEDYEFSTVDNAPIKLGRYSYIDGVVQGADAGHYSNLVGAPNFTGNVIPEYIDSIKWAALQTNTTVVQRFVDYGYAVDSGYGDFPNAAADNTWRKNIYDWMNYLKLFNNENIQAVSDLNDRMDNLDATEVIHYPADNLIDEVDLDWNAATSAAGKDIRTSSTTDLAFKIYNLDQVAEHQGTTTLKADLSGGSTDDFCVDAIDSEEYPLDTGTPESTGYILLDPFQSKVRPDLSKYTNGVRDTAKIGIFDYIVRPKIQGLYVDAFYTEQFTVFNQNLHEPIGARDNKLTIYQRYPESSPYNFVDRKLFDIDFDNYWSNPSPLATSDVPNNGVIDWVQHGNYVYLLVGTMSWAPKRFFTDEAPVSGSYDVIRWDLQTQTETLITTLQASYPITSESLYDYLYLDSENPRDDYEFFVTDDLIFFQLPWKDPEGFYNEEFDYYSPALKMELIVHNMNTGRTTNSVETYDILSDVDNGVPGFPTYNYWYCSNLHFLPHTSANVLLQTAVTDEDTSYTDDVHLGTRTILVDAGDANTDPTVTYQPWKFLPNTDPLVQYTGSNRPDYFRYTRAIEYTSTGALLGISFPASWGTINSGDPDYITNGMEVTFSELLNLDNILVYDYVSNSLTDSKYAPVVPTVNFSAKSGGTIAYNQAYIEYYNQVVPTYGAMGIAIDPYTENVYVSGAGLLYQGNYSATCLAVMDSNFSVLKTKTASDMGVVNVQSNFGMIAFQPQLVMQAGRLNYYQTTSPHYHYESYNGVFSNCVNANGSKFDLTLDLDTSGFTAGVATMTIDTSIINALNTVNKGTYDLLIFKNGGFGTRIYTPSVTVDAAQGDTFSLQFVGILDWQEPLPAPGPNLTVPIYSEADTPKFRTYSDVSEITGKSVAEVLDLLYANLISTNYDVSYNFFGGETTLLSFDNFVKALAGVDLTYLEENITLTANTPYTVTHSLGHKLVVPSVYSYAGGLSLNPDVILVDNNSLTITSSTNATVSIFIKA